MTEKTMTSGIGGSPTSNGDQAALALKSNVLESARGLSDEMKHLADDVAGEAKKTAESGLSAGKKRATDGLASVANAIRKTGEHLRSEDQGGFTEYFDRAAHQVDVASDYLQRKTIGQVVGDVEHFARREPALFLGGAFVAGLVGGRFLKSSGSGPRRAAHDGALGGRLTAEPATGRADGSRYTGSPSVEARGHRTEGQTAAPKATPSRDATSKPKSESESKPAKPGAT
jgi:hypothetical protein